MNRILLNIILLTIILTTLFSCNGQNSSQNSKEKNKTTILGKVVSELDQSIWVIYQDKKSNYWYGSKENGVFRYNGQELMHFTKEDGLINNQIRGIQEDALGNIFFETTSGIDLFDGNSIKSLKSANNDVSTNGWKLEPNDLWFSAGYQKNGTYRYDGKLLYHLEFPKSPQEDTFTSKYPNASHNPYGVYSIFKDSNGYIWFGTSDMGIYRFDGEAINYLYEKQLTETPNGGAFGIRSIAEDKNGHIWICNSDYKFKVLQNNYESTELVPIRYERQIGIENKEKETQYFLSIVADNNENLWMLTYEGGVWRNDGKELIYYPVKDGENDAKLYSIFKDKQGVIWIGTQNSGVFKFNGDSFEKFNI